MTRRLAISLLLAFGAFIPARAEADWFVRPLVGVSLMTDHGYVDLEQTAGKSKAFFGAAVGWQPNALGLEVEFAAAPGFFRDTGDLVVEGALSSVMGNVTWVLPRPGASARLRAYVSGGAGVIRVSLRDRLEAFASRSTLIAGNAGGGIAVRVTPRIHINGDARYFKSQFGDHDQGGFGEEFVSFARVSGGIVFRF